MVGQHVIRANSYSPLCSSAHESIRKSATWSYLCRVHAYGTS